MSATEVLVSANGHDVIARARAGDREAFAELVEAHGPDVHRLCALITTDTALAEDAAQNTWQQVWRRLDTLRDTARFRAWLLKLAANEAKQLMRRNRRHVTRSLEAARHERAKGGDLDDDLDLRTALRALKPADRELLAHRYLFGLTSDEIARQFGLSPEGVRSRLKRLRDRLQKELQADV